MEIKVGIQHIGREVNVETDQSAKEVEQAFTEALEQGSVLSLSDARGRRVLIPAARIGYLELGDEHSRRVGFGSV